MGWGRDGIDQTGMVTVRNALSLFNCCRGRVGWGGVGWGGDGIEKTRIVTVRNALSPFNC